MLVVVVVALMLLLVVRLPVYVYKQIAVACGRRRGRGASMTVEVGVALLLGDALAGCCEAILMSSLVLRVRLVPLLRCYHVRGGWRATSTASPCRLDC